MVATNAHEAKIKEFPELNELCKEQESRIEALCDKNKENLKISLQNSSKH